MRPERVAGMMFCKLPLEGARIIELDKFEDERGFFARSFCEREFKAEGLESQFVQMNNSLSAKRGTLRGMHYQLPPSSEVKIVRCIRGALWDAIVDLRPNSSTFLKWFGTELSAENRLMMYVPRGFAHGMLTLSDDAEALYLMSNFYDPGAERGLRWDDPAIGIQWPDVPLEISPKDAKWPDFDAYFHGIELMRSLSDA